MDRGGDRPAGLEDGESGDHGFGRAFQGHGDDRVRPDASRREDARQPSATPDQLPVGERSRHGGHGDGLRRARRPGLDLVVDRDVERRRGLSGAPLEQGLVALGRAQQREIGEPPVGLLQDAGEQMRELPEQPSAVVRSKRSVACSRARRSWPSPATAKA